MSRIDLRLSDRSFAESTLTAWVDFCQSQHLSYWVMDNCPNVAGPGQHTSWNSQVVRSTLFITLGNSFGHQSLFRQSPCSVSVPHSCEALQYSLGAFWLEGTCVPLCKVGWGWLEFMAYSCTIKSTWLWNCWAMSLFGEL